MPARNRRFVWDAKKQKVVEVKAPRQPRRISGYVRHESDAAGVHPSDAVKASQHAAKHGCGNITFSPETGKMIVKNGSHRQVRKYLKTIGMHDKKSFF